MEQVTGIEPASPAWKAGALAIVLHLHSPSAKIVSSVIIASNTAVVNSFREIPFAFLRCRKEADDGGAAAAGAGGEIMRRREKKTLQDGGKCGIIYCADMQRYRSGHNGADSKSV